MGLLRRLADVFDPPPPIEERAGGFDFDPRLVDFDRPGRQLAVGADSVLSNLSVANACVRLRSELLAGVPLELFRRTPDGGAERAEDHPLFWLLRDAPNDRQTAFEARELAGRSLDLAGNAYARVARDRTGNVTAFRVVAPGAVSVELLRGARLRYRFMEPQRPPEVALEGAGEVLHVRAASHDGFIGRSPLHAARGALALALAGAQTEANIMANSLRPSGVFLYDKVLKPNQREELQKLLTDMVTSKNAGAAMLLEAGVRFEKVSFSAKDSELLGSRKLAAEDVARIFGVPPAVVGIGDRPTYGSAVEEARQLVQNALQPLAARIEGAMERDLLSEAERRTYFIRHDFGALLRGDLKSRFEAYKIGREAGILSPNDCRRREGEAPIENGDEYIRPLNFTPLGTPPAPPAPPREVD
ncbi:phage portal protein [Pelagibius sp. CAU 1746]|uniref:phage portal protein n=1 Tax=Pelagibius sp. CAU 1746 TaxID=3140370 RepID=UPI00325B0539